MRRSDCSRFLLCKSCCYCNESSRHIDDIICLYLYLYKMFVQVHVSIFIVLSCCHFESWTFTFNVWDWQTLAKISFYLCKVFETVPLFAYRHLKVFKNVQILPNYFFLLSMGIRIWCWFFRSIFEKSLQRIWNLHQFRVFLYLHCIFEENFFNFLFFANFKCICAKKTFSKILPQVETHILAITYKSPFDSF